MTGGHYFEPQVTAALLNLLQQEETDQHGLNAEELSQREMEVLSLITEGLGNKEIAARLFISENRKDPCGQYFRKITGQIAYPSRPLRLQDGLV